MKRLKVEPELLVDRSGEAVSAQGWPARRRELYDAIIPHEYGGMPPSGTGTNAVLLSSTTTGSERKVGYRTYEVRTAFEGGREVSFVLNMWIPPGEGPHPVVVDGDGCWRTFHDGVIAETVRRGNIAVSFNRTCLAADVKDGYRDTGLYRVFPGAEFGVLSAWAWGYHRVVDALAKIREVRPDRIAITGHSRGGKTVLLAGATDERIAITNPNCSGTGGSGLNRLKCAGAEVVNDFFRSGNIFWFGKGFAEHRHRDRELPYDQHYLHALAAPRGLLVTEAYGDVWANPPGSYAACRATQEVYELLGAQDRIGWCIREGAHEHSLPDYEVLLDFVDLHFHGRKVVREFHRGLFPDLADVLS